MASRVVFAIGLSAALAVAQAPAGYKTFENKLQRVTFYYPVVFQEVPLPPTEQVEVAKYVLKEQPEEMKRVDERIFKQLKPSLTVFCFDLAAPKTPGGNRPATGEKPASGDPATLREAMEAESRVGSWAKFVERLAGWRLEDVPKKPDHFRLAWAGQWSVPGCIPVGYLVRKQVGSTVLGVYGLSLLPGEKTLQTQVTKVANGLQLVGDAANDKAEAEIDKLYASGKFRAVDFRKKARAELASGWKAVDTENYLIVHHSKNEGLVRHIARDIEAMRAFYTQVFPPVGAMDSLSIVRICRTKDEYHQYGGPPNTGGYWHPGNEELVFYDYSYTMKTMDEDERKRLEKAKVKLTDDDALLVLYHEALHQYIHYSIGEFSPHDWFNEGYGDYFSGAVVGDDGKVLRIDPSPWRIHTAKDMCEFGEGFIPLKEILEAERAVFYNPARIRFFYAGAWSFLFFMKTSKEVAAHPVWSKMLGSYFDTVKASYAEELQKAGENPDLGQKTVAGFNARRKALKTTLEGVDIPELEKVWRKWVIDMKDPWPSKRQKRK